MQTPCLYVVVGVDVALVVGVVDAVVVGVVQMQSRPKLPVPLTLHIWFKHDCTERHTPK